jgi:hypothetical protein
MFGLITGVLLTILANTPGGALRQRRRQILVKEHRGTPRPRLGYAGHFFKFYCAVTLASVDSVISNFCTRRPLLKLHIVITDSIWAATSTLIISCHTKTNHIVESRDKSKIPTKRRP